MQEKTYESDRGPSLPSGTRREILELLLRRRMTAAEIAGRLEISPTAVRQHLAPLRGLGLVERRKDAPTTGRPTFRYGLSALGRRAFPKRHDLLLVGLVEVLVERHGADAVLDVVEAAARRLARRVEARFEGLDDDERWEALLAWLEEEFEWEATPEPGAREEREAGSATDSEAGAPNRIVLHHCPFEAVSLENPPVCGRFFATLVSTLTGAARVEHVPIRDGLRCCALEVESA